MSSIDEKRVYGAKEGRVRAFVASSVGVVGVDVSADRVGEYGVEHRCTARDVAGVDGAVAAAAGEDAFRREGGSFLGTEFGSAVAVGFDGDDLVAASPDGEVARRSPADGWEASGAIAGAANALCGDLLAADTGVYRVADGLAHVGLDAARDVAVADGADPLAATDDGVYELGGGGWTRVQPGAFRVVAIDPAGDRAHAATADALYARRDREWAEVDVPTADSIADVAYAPDTVLAITDAGSLLADAGSGWRGTALGVPDVGGVAVP